MVLEHFLTVDVLSVYLASFWRLNMRMGFFNGYTQRYTVGFSIRPREDFLFQTCDFSRK